MRESVSRQSAAKVAGTVLFGWSLTIEPSKYVLTASRTSAMMLMCCAVLKVNQCTCNSSIGRDVIGQAAESTATKREYSVLHLPHSILLLRPFDRLAYIRSQGQDRNVGVELHKLRFEADCCNLNLCRAPGRQTISVTTQAGKANRDWYLAQ